MFVKKTLKKSNFFLVGRVIKKRNIAK